MEIVHRFEIPGRCMKVGPRSSARRPQIHSAGETGLTPYSATVTVLVSV
jgi:hypothetical protein